MPLRHRVAVGKERWAEHTKVLPDLKPGQNVFIQNQQSAGKLSKQWDRTGLLIGNDGNNKYTGKVDGSGRMLQLKKVLKKFQTDDFETTRQKNTVA